MFTSCIVSDVVFAVVTNVGIDGAITGIDGAITGIDDAITGIDGAITGIDGAITGIDNRDRRCNNRHVAYMFRWKACLFLFSQIKSKMQHSCWRVCNCLPSQLYYYAFDSEWLIFPPRTCGNV